MRKSIVLIFLVSLFATSSNAQGGLLGRMKDKIKQKADSLLNKKGNDAIDGAANKIFGKKKPANTAEASGTSGTAETSGATGNNLPLNSQINDKDLVQNASNPPPDTNNTRVQITKNLFIDIKGKYPVGYAPKWRFLGTASALDFDKEDYIYPTTNVKHEKKAITLLGYEDKTVLAFDAFTSCDCYAEVKINNTVVLTETPQTFRVTGFQKVLNGKMTGEKCRSSWNIAYLNGGFEGKITLSANSNGDITMNLMIENYSEETKSRKYDPETKGYPEKVHPSSVSFRYLANNIIISNEMPAQKAMEIIAAEKEAKQRRADFIAKSNRQIDSVVKVIAKKYTGTECRSCFFRSRGAKVVSNTTDYVYVNSGDYARSETTYDLNTSLVIQNKCDYKLMFVGIQQLYDETQGYYYKDVTQTMDAGYQYQSEQGIFSYAFTSLLGMNTDLYLQDKYDLGSATVNSIQWLRVYKAK